MCPKKIPLQDQLGMLRRKMGFSQAKHLFLKLMPGGNKTLKTGA
jgi:fumarate reductase iron-sulfur subunit